MKFYFSKLFLSLVLALLSFSEFVYCQDPPELIFHRYTTNDGLSNNFLTTIKQDYKGFLWIGSLEGLTRFDGYDFFQFRHIPFDTTTIPLTSSLEFIADSNNDFWVYTDDSRFYRYDKVLRTFSEKRVRSNEIKNFHINQVIAAEKDFFWIATFDFGLLKLNIRTMQLESTHYDSVLSKTSVLHLIADTLRQVVYAGTEENGLFVIPLKQGNVFHVPLEKPFNEIQSMFLGSENSLWIGTSSSGLFRFDTETKLLTRLNSFTQRLKADPALPVYFYSIAEDHRRNLWLGSSQGLIYFNRKKDVVHSYKSNPDNSSSISSNDVTNVLFDSTQTLWITTLKGLNSAYLPQDVFDSKVIQGTQNLTNVRALWKHPDGKLWIFTSRFGILEISPNEMPDVTKNSLKITTETPIRSFVQVSESQIWVGDMKGGIDVIDIYSKQKLKRFTEKDGLCTGYIQVMFKDSKKRIWVGTEKGLCLFNEKENRFISFTNSPNNPNSISNDEIKCIFEDDNQTIWIGTNGGGLNQFLEKDSGFAHFVHDKKNLNSISCDYLNSMTQDSAGTIWIASREGLNKFDSVKKIFSHYSTNDGLPSNYIMSILIDSNQKLWIGTLNGLSQFDPSSGVFINFSQSDGLKEVTFVSNSSYKDKNGLFYFGTSTGWVSFNPIDFSHQSVSSRLTFTKFLKFGKPYYLGLDYNQIDTVNLSFSESYFGVEFSALPYRNSGVIKYAYKLEGFDQDWVILTNSKSRAASFTNLNPGLYELKIKSTNENGEWNKNYIHVYINIIPLLWQETWFRILIALLLILVTFIIVRYRIFRFKQFEKIRWQIAGDLHDEIGGNLSSIALRTELLIQTSESMGLLEKKQLGQIINKTTLMINQMDDIVWAINPENDKLEDMIFRMKDMTVELLTYNHIMYSFNTSNIDSNKRLSIEKKKNIYLIFKESLNNIIKHSGATVVKISIAVNLRELKLEVTDNGVGFEEFVIKYGHGLKLQKRRAREIGADFELLTKRNSGTTIILKVKI